jgi:hypothetical protein
MNAYDGSLVSEKRSGAGSEKSAKVAGAGANAPFADNRGVAAQMRSLQEMANNSPRVQQLAATQKAVNGQTAAMPLAPVQAVGAGQEVAQLVRSTDLQDEIKPGPPPTYRLGSRFLKKLNRKEKAEAIHQNWIDAYIGGLPTPNFGIEKLEDTADWVFWTEQAKGDVFFQFSKPGHTDRVVNWIAKQPSGRLVELEQTFKNYLVGDAQGFFEDKPYGQIEFIDVQKQISGGPMKEIGEMITARLNKAIGK